MKQVYTSVRPLDAELVRMELRKASIGSILVNEFSALYADGMGPILAPLIVAVSDRDERRAARVVEQTLVRRKKRRKRTSARK